MHGKVEKKRSTRGALSVPITHSSNELDSVDIAVYFTSERLEKLEIIQRF